MNADNPRRQFLTRLGIGALVATGAAALAACGKGGGPVACADPTGGTKAQRDALKYVDVAIDPAKKCVTCAQYVPGDGCGTCKIFNNSPVAPGGSCDSFAKKT